MCLGYHLSLIIVGSHRNAQKLIYHSPRHYYMWTLPGLSRVIKCGFAFVRHWRSHADLTGEENFSAECLNTTNGYNYVGTANSTLAGRLCQAWNTQYPHAHSYDDTDYFADNPSTVDDVRNYCRNLRLSSYDARPWCLTTDNGVKTEFCDIPYCKGELLVYRYYLISIYQTPVSNVTENAEVHV